MKGCPLLKGMSESYREIVKRISELAEKKVWKMSQVVLLWIIQKGTVLISGSVCVYHVIAETHRM